MRRGGSRGGFLSHLNTFVMFFELLLKHQSIGFDQVNMKYTIKWHCSSYGKNIMGLPALCFV